MAESEKPRRRFAYQGAVLPVPAQVAGEELSRIESRDGGVTPDVLVEENRPQEAPLHRCFTWDDQEAAKKCRLHEASRVIRTVRIVQVDTDSGEKVVTPAFVSVHRRETDRREYVAVIKAMSDEEYRAAVLSEALAQINGLRNRYAALRELEPIWQAVAQVANPPTPVAV